MTRLPEILAVLFVVAALEAQSNDDTYRHRRDAKLARPVFQRSDWTSDYESALAAARREDKLILAYFTRSFAP